MVLFNPAYTANRFRSGQTWAEIPDELHVALNALKHPIVVRKTMTKHRLNSNKTLKQHLDSSKHRLNSNKTSKQHLDSSDLLPPSSTLTNPNID
jgi:hypothetical protein